MQRTFDVVVIGSGPVGAALALTLHAAGINTLLLEAREGAAPRGSLRPLALSHGSRLILERIGVWSALDAPTPIENIHVSQRGRFGRTLLSRDEAALPALGYVTDYARLVESFDTEVARRGVNALRGARVTAVSHDPSSAHVEYTSAAGTSDCIASLVAIADGNALTADVDVSTTDYGQSAVTATVEIDRPHRHTAYERFTPEGPLALLPFGERAGRFTRVDSRAAQHLTLRVAERIASGRAVLIGNAAQALHPVAGQGFNLGLRDAWELATEVKRRGAADEALPRAYAARRRSDRNGGIAFTDALVRIFSNDFARLGAARGAGLALLDNLPPAKSFVVRRMIFGTRG